MNQEKLEKYMNMTKQLLVKGRTKEALQLKRKTTLTTKTLMKNEDRETKEEDGSSARRPKENIDFEHDKTLVEGRVKGSRPYV